LRGSGKKEIEVELFAGGVGFADVEVLLLLVLGETLRA
jgi:hypothetical protein